LDLLQKILDTSLAAGIAVVLAVIAMRMLQATHAERIRDLKDEADRRAADRAIADANFARLEQMYRELAELHARTLDVVERNTQAWARLTPGRRQKPAA